MSTQHSIDENIRRRTSRVRKMAKDITVVESRHSDFRNHHLKKSGKGREDAKFVGIETKACRSGKIATLHDPRGHENFGVLSVDNLQASGALEVT